MTLSVWRHFLSAASREIEILTVLASLLATLEKSGKVVRRLFQHFAQLFDSGIEGRDLLFLKFSY